MSLIHNPLPLPPRNREAEMQREIDALKGEVRELKIKLMRAEEEASDATQGAARVRAALEPLYRGLQRLFGDLEAMGTASPSADSGHVDDRHKAVWESWKQKLGGTAAKIIDALLLHGELTQSQIAIHIGTSRKQTVYDVVCKMNKAGIITKNGGKVSLKDIQ